MRRKSVTHYYESEAPISCCRASIPRVRAVALSPTGRQVNVEDRPTFADRTDGRWRNARSYVRREPSVAPTELPPP
jgi:hypothetical protein